MASADTDLPSGVLSVAAQDLNRQFGGVPWRAVLTSATSVVWATRPSTNVATQGSYERR